MAKKNENAFDLQAELKDYPKPTFLKNAFMKIVDVDKIKSKSDLDKAFKKFEELQ